MAKRVQERYQTCSAGGGGPLVGHPAEPNERQPLADEEQLEVRLLAAMDTPGVEALLADADAGGHAFVRRLVQEYRAGTNQSNRRGEALYGAFRNGWLVGVGGMNVDPYAGDPRIGRLRHVYVHSDERRRGVGRALVGALLARARGTFGLVRLRTHNHNAAAFYESLGFAAVRNEATATHVLRLTPPQWPDFGCRHLPE